jgi:hypothetical protein
MSLNIGRSQKDPEGGIEMGNGKSVLIVFHDAWWLALVIAIFVTTIAASSLVSRFCFGRFRHVAARSLR